MERKLQENGLNCELIWEDREVFLIEIPSFSAQNVGISFLSLFHDSKILEQSSTGILSKFTKILGFNKN
jgi:hypothetical protein